ncbi:MAG TPA: hypothetical protein VGC78_13815 [Gaiellaceae bacterium]
MQQTTGLGRDEKLARNQALFREVNERISGLASAFGLPDRQLDLICECSDETCTSTIKVPVDEYELVRTFPARFVIYPRHDVPQIENIVGSGRGYEVVEKFGDAATLVADLDPRARVAATGGDG